MSASAMIGNPLDMWTSLMTEVNFSRVANPMSGTPLEPETAAPEI